MNWSIRYAAWKTKFEPSHYAIPFQLSDYDIGKDPRNPGTKHSAIRWKFHVPVDKWNMQQLPPIGAILTEVFQHDNKMVSHVLPLSSKTGLFDVDETPMHEQIYNDNDLYIDHDHTDHQRAHLEALRNFIHNYRGLLHEPTERTDWEE